MYKCALALVVLPIPKSGSGGFGFGVFAARRRQARGGFDSSALASLALMLSLHPPKTRGPLQADGRPWRIEVINGRLSAENRQGADMAKTLDERIKETEARLAALASKRREITKREDAKRLIALGGRIERAGGDWLAGLDDAKLKALLDAAKRHSSRDQAAA